MGRGYLCSPLADRWVADRIVIEVYTFLIVHSRIIMVILNRSGVIVPYHSTENRQPREWQNDSPASSHPDSLSHAGRNDTRQR